MSAHLHPRLAVAASAAPVSGTVLAALAMTSWMGCIDEVCFPATAGVGATYGGFAGIVLGWPLMLMLGLPVHGWLLRHGRTAALAYLFVGAVIGVAGAAGLQGLIWRLPAPALRSPGSAFRLRSVPAARSPDWRSGLSVGPTATAAANPAYIASMSNTVDDSTDGFRSGNPGPAALGRGAALWRHGEGNRR
ncbi:MAG: hypothetical protein R3C16_07765 [Hyphomonadaceae bacterium]